MFSRLGSPLRARSGRAYASSVTITIGSIIFTAIIFCPVTVRRERDRRSAVKFDNFFFIDLYVFCYTNTIALGFSIGSKKQKKKNVDLYIMLSFCYKLLLNSRCSIDKYSPMFRRLNNDSSNALFF